MDKNALELKKFLEEQIEWCKQRDAILEKIENKLNKMKNLAEYVRDHDLTLNEVNRINKSFITLKREVYSLEQQLQSEVN